VNAGITGEIPHINGGQSPAGEGQWPGSSKVLSEFCWPPRGSRRCGHRLSRSRRKSELPPRPVHADRPSGD
jgi:hypothetical protein